MLPSSFGVPVIARLQPSISFVENVMARCSSLHLLICLFTAFSAAFSPLAASYLYLVQARADFPSASYSQTHNQLVMSLRASPDVQIKFPIKLKNDFAISSKPFDEAIELVGLQDKLDEFIPQDRAALIPDIDVLKDFVDQTFADSQNIYLQTPSAATTTAAMKEATATAAALKIATIATKEATASAACLSQKKAVRDSLARSLPRRIAPPGTEATATAACLPQKKAVRGSPATPMKLSNNTIRFGTLCTQSAGGDIACAAKKATAAAASKKAVATAAAASKRTVATATDVDELSVTSPTLKKDTATDFDGFLSLDQLVERKAVVPLRCCFPSCLSELSPPKNELEKICLRL